MAKEIWKATVKDTESRKIEELQGEVIDLQDIVTKAENLLPPNKKVIKLEFLGDSFNP